MADPLTVHSESFVVFRPIGYVVSEPDHGIYHAWQSIAAATGDFLFFLNADDQFFDDRVVEDVVTVFDQRPDLEIVYGNLIWMLQHPGSAEAAATITREFLASTTILHQTVFAKKHVLKPLVGFPKSTELLATTSGCWKSFCVIDVTISTTIETLLLCARRP